MMISFFGAKKKKIKYLGKRERQDKIPLVFDQGARTKEA